MKLDINLYISQLKENTQRYIEKRLRIDLFASYGDEEYFETFIQNGLDSRISQLGDSVDNYKDFCKVIELMECLD